jgi:hypothetical protein
MSLMHDIMSPPESAFAIKRHVLAKLRSGKRGKHLTNRTALALPNNAYTIAKTLEIPDPLKRQTAEAEHPAAASEISLQS